MLKILQTCNQDIRVKALDDGTVYIEGWANKAVVDRGKDLIPKSAWKVDNYKKNSIMLFNHDHSTPIGRMIDVEAKDDGLYVKGRISNSSDPTISRVRDLVKEGILNSFSVGIMVDGEDFKDGVNHVKSAELHEVSIVSVPMNQDSQFQLAAKGLKGKFVDAMSALSGALGYKDVEKACNILHNDDKIYDSIDEMAEAITNICGAEIKEVSAFLRLSKTTPSEVKAWLQKNDHCDKQKKSTDKTTDNEVQAIKVPKSAFSSMEELQTWAQQSGWSTENLTDVGDNYLLVQKPEDQFSGDLTEVDMGDGVSAIVGKLIVEVEVNDEETDSSNENQSETAVAEDAGTGARENDNQSEDTAQLKDRFTAETADAVSGEAGKNPPSWVADESLWDKAKRASEAALGEISYAFVVWWYLDQGGSRKSVKALLDGNVMTQPIAGADASQTEINPTLDQAKQTNVLLSSAVMLLQQMLEKMDSMRGVNPPVVTTESQKPMPTSEEAALAKRIESFTKRLSVLGL